MTLSSLISKLEAADAGSRELDDELHAALLPDHYFSQLADAPEGCGCMMYKWPSGTISSALHATVSLDAAVRLLEEMLPGWYWQVREWPDAHAELWSGHGEDNAEFFGSGFDACGNPPATPALALCIALLKALEASRG